MATGLSSGDRFLQKFLLRVRPASLASRLKRLFGVRRRPVELSQGTFFLDPISQFAVAVCSPGEYEPETAEALRKLLPTGGTFVDLGANEGYFTVMASKIAGPLGRVLAIDPQPRIKPIIEKNIELNGLANVVFAPVAISDQPGTATMHLFPDTNTGASSLATGAAHYKLPTVDVPVMTLAALLDREKFERVDLLKVDIEGYEYEALLGAEDLLRSGRIEKIILEIHPHLIEPRGLDPGAIEKMLLGAGYLRDESFAPIVYRR